MKKVHCSARNICNRLGCLSKYPHEPAMIYLRRQKCTHFRNCILRIGINHNKQVRCIKVKK